MTNKALDRYELLGRSGLRVSPLALGAMTFGTEWGWGADERDARRIFDTYVARGGNFIDTANVYTGGTAEKLFPRRTAGEPGGRVREGRARSAGDRAKVPRQDDPRRSELRRQPPQE